MASKTLRFTILALVLIVVVSSVALAQGVINYGTSIQGEINATSPQGFYTFNGNAGDLITAHILSTANNLSPTLALIGPAGQLAFSNSDIFTSVTNDASITYRLPSSGAYTLLVGAAPGTEGSYVLSLQNNPPTVSIGLVSGQETTANIPLGAPTQVYSFSADPVQSTSLLIQSQATGFAFTAIVRDSNGQVVAVVGQGVETFSLSLPPGTGNYEIVVSSADPETQGVLSVLAGAGLSTTSTSTTTSTDSTQNTATATENQPPAGVCSATPAEGGVNIRSGPSIDYSVLGSLASNTFMVISGQYNGWYNGSYAGQSAWLAGSVIVLNGPCQGLQTVAAPPLPTATSTPVQETPSSTEESIATEEPPATEEPQSTEEPQATEEPVATEEPQATEEPSAQEAPADSNFVQPDLVIPLDNTVSRFDYVSYPGGDTEDRIRFSVSGMNQNATSSGGRADLLIVASCSGPGSEHIQFFTGGQTYACGDTIVAREVTFDSNSGSVIITATGGQGTYVNWSLTGTATRK